MKLTKKITIYIIIFSIVVSNTFFSYTFADTSEEGGQCPACSATPDGMQMYINFQVELLGILQGSEAENNKTTSIKRSGLFNSGILKVGEVFAKSVASKMKKEIDNELKAIRSLNISTVLLYKLTLSHALSEGMLSMAIIFRNESFVRDYKILQEIDMATNDIIWDMGEQGIWKKKISPAVFMEIQDLIRRYSKEYGGRYPIFESISIADNVKNRQLMTMVYRLNSLMKGILYTIEIPSLVGANADIIEAFYSEGNWYSNNWAYNDEMSDFWSTVLNTNGEILIEINDDFLDYVIKDYKCAVGGCNYGTKRAARNLAKQVKQDFSKFLESSIKSRDIIKTSSKELADVIAKAPKTYTKTVRGSENNGGLTDKEIQLLRTVYGADTKNLTNSQLESFKSLFKGVKEDIRPLKEAVTETTDGIASKWKEAKGGEGLRALGKVLAFRNRGKNKKSDEDIVTTAKEIQKATLKDNILHITQYSAGDIQMFKINDEEKKDNTMKGMQAIVDVVLTEKVGDKMFVMLGVNQDVLYFYQIGQYIHSIAENQIEGEGGLVDTLGETCTKQCSNKGTKNCFAK